MTERVIKGSKPGRVERNEGRQASAEIEITDGMVEAVACVLEDFTDLGPLSLEALAKECLIAGLVRREQAQKTL